MKISIVTAVFNRADCISDALESLQNQTHPQIEHVVIDGASTDGTLELLRGRLGSQAVLVSEPDNGIYDALNKGFAKATGEVIGLLHSDDFFADNQVLADVAKVFNDEAVHAVYGDLQYVSKANTNKVIRHWTAGECSRSHLEWGWMPPHPTLFLRRSVIERWGDSTPAFGLQRITIPSCVTLAEVVFSLPIYRVYWSKCEWVGKAIVPWAKSGASLVRITVRSKRMVWVGLVL